jgi:hypothetical protein
MVDQTSFTGKTWIHIAVAIVFGSLAIFGLTFGPLFLFEIMKNARGQPAADAGVALTIMSIPLSLVFALAVFNILARRRPILRVCREGLAINMIGSSSLDGIPFIPGIIRVAWLIISLQGFKQYVVWVPWESLQNAVVFGPRMSLTMVIIGAVFQPTHAETATRIPIANELTFHEAAFRARLDEIASSINTHHQYPKSRENLPSWNE